MRSRMSSPQLPWVFGALERLGQVVGILGEAPVHLHHVFDLCCEGRAPVALLHVDLVDLGAELVELSLQGIQELPQIGLVLLGKALGFVFEDFVCQGLELVGELFSRAFEQGKFFGTLLLLAGEGGIGGGELRA